MIKKIITICIFSVWSIFSIAQQDKHLSMWNENASSLNPAAAGVMDEDIRLLTNFRMQWSPLTGNAMRTNAFSFDSKLMKNKTNGSHLGFGINFTNDQTGDVRITSNLVSVPIAYNLALDQHSFISLGVAPGFYSQSLAGGNQTWNNQWNGTTFDQSINSGEVLQAKVSSFDVGAGMQYKYKFEGYSFFTAGFAVNHITAPNMGFVSLNNNLFRSFNITLGGTKFMEDRSFGISPQALISLMGPNYNILVGSYFDHELFESSKRTDYVQRSIFSYGFFYRYKDAAVLSLMFKANGFKVGVSYDINVSKLNTATRSSGGLELFLKYSMMADKSTRIHDRKLFRWRGGNGGL